MTNIAKALKLALADIETVLNEYDLRTLERQEYQVICNKLDGLVADADATEYRNGLPVRKTEIK